MKNNKIKVKNLTISDIFKLCKKIEHCRDCPLYFFSCESKQWSCIFDTRTEHENAYLDKVIEVIK